VKAAKKKLVRFPNGSKRHEVELSSITIPDCWHIAANLRDAGNSQAADMVLECWHLCHDLLEHAREGGA
jgi:hypothetical protein